MKRLPLMLAVVHYTWTKSEYTRNLKHSHLVATHYPQTLVLVLVW